MKLHYRKFQNEEDYWGIRQLLREIYLANDGYEHSWPVYCWDYWRWHLNRDIYLYSLEAAVFLWETHDGRLAAVLHPNEPGEAVLHIHPDSLTQDLLVEMLSVAETQFATTQPYARQRLVIWSHESDFLRKNIFDRRGYVRQGLPEFEYRRTIDTPLPEFHLRNGISIRPLGDENEHSDRCWLSWEVTYPGANSEGYPGWEWYENVQRCPLYRRDLDLVAMGPKEEFVGYCTLWFDDCTRTAAIEPVGVDPQFIKKGIGQAIVAEGLRRSYRLGADVVTVTLASTDDRELFTSLGFVETGVREPWVKEW